LIPFFAKVTELCFPLGQAGLLPEDSKVQEETGFNPVLIGFEKSTLIPS
jgi:hypothetical protein